MTPAESGSSGVELFGHRTVIFLGVKRAVFAHGIAQQQVEQRPWSVPQFAVAMNDGSDVGLKVLPDRFIGFVQESRGIGRLDLVEVIAKRERFPIEKIAGPCDAVESNLVSSGNQASKSVSGIADPRQVAPGAGRIAGMDSDAVAVDTPRRLARHFFAGCTAAISKDQLIGGQRDCFAELGGRETFGQRRRGGFSSLVGRGFENRFAELIEPLVFGHTSSWIAVQQMMLFEQPGK